MITNLIIFRLNYIQYLFLVYMVNLYQHMRVHQLEDLEKEELITLEPIHVKH